jgi:hypothetical protein
MCVLPFLDRVLAAINEIQIESKSIKIFLFRFCDSHKIKSTSTARAEE